MYTHRHRDNKAMPRYVPQDGLRLSLENLGYAKEDIPVLHERLVSMGHSPVHPANDITVWELAKELGIHCSNPPSIVRRDILRLGYPAAKEAYIAKLILDQGYRREDSVDPVIIHEAAKKLGIKPLSETNPILYQALQKMDALFGYSGI